MYSDTLPLSRLLLPAYVLSLPDQESGLPQLPSNQDLQSPGKDGELPFLHDRTKDNFQYLLPPVHLLPQAEYPPSD